MITPSYVPESVKSQWENVFASNFHKGEDVAKITANIWLQQNSTIADPNAALEETVMLSFTVDDSGPELVKQTLNTGDYFISAVLADNAVTRTGHKFSEALLLKIADQINKQLPVGDMDHEEMTRLEGEGYSPSEVAEKLKSRQKNGIVKAVQAIYEKGKLWVKLQIDKRYRKIMNKAKGLSVEVLAKVQSTTKEILDADFLGFTVAYRHDPANPRALISMAQ